jgi:hypothetical protein
VVIRKGVFTLNFWNYWIYDLSHLSKSLTCGDSPRGNALDFCIHGSLILSSVPVLDLCWLAKGDLPMTFGIMYRWSYHPSKSLTCGDSPRRIPLWQILRCVSMIISFIQVVDLWSFTKRIFAWPLESCIEDPIIRPSRWLLVTRQGGFPLDFGNYVSFILSSVQVVDLWWLAKQDFRLTFWNYVDLWS